jgi:hypothetical protein
MANQTKERNAKLDVLIELVEKDFKELSHWPTAENWQIGLILLVTILPMAMILLILYFAGSSIGPSGVETFLAVLFTLIPAACALLLSSFKSIQENAKVGRFRRISKILEKDSKYKSINNTRYQVILCSLIEIRTTVDVPLSELRTEMHDLFKERKLLNYLFQ